MATRKGEVVLLSEFMDEAVKKARQEIRKRKRDKAVNVNAVSEAIGIAAVRYHIARIEQNKAVIFNWDEALNFEGNSAPYLQYTYVRATNILKKLEKSGKKIEPSYKVNEKEYALTRELNNFKKIASDALDKLSPYLLANYTYELTKAFNDFYESCPVIQEKKAGIKAQRIAIVLATKQVLENVLSILGIQTIEAM